MFIKTFINTLLILLLIWIIIFFAQFGKPTLMSQWIYDVYTKKLQIASNIKKPKILFIAGSNILFGLNTPYLQKHLKKPILNLGVNAGVGLPVILHYAKKALKPNDIAILPLEYELYLYNGKAGVQMIDYILSREPKLFFSLTFKEQLYILWHTTFKRLLNGYFDNSIKPLQVGPYGLKNINKYGDQINNDTKHQTKQMLQELKKLQLNPPSFFNKFNTNAISFKYLQNFQKWCKKRHIKVIFTPPTLMYNKKYYTNKKYINFFTNLPKLLNSKGFTYIGNPYDFFYNPSFYFNTNYHLKQPYQKKFSRQLVNLLDYHLINNLTFAPNPH